LEVSFRPATSRPRLATDRSIHHHVLVLPVDADPSADFTKLLITGARRGEGTDTISQFLGGRLTERVRLSDFLLNRVAWLIDSSFDLAEPREVGNDGHSCSYDDSTSVLSEPSASFRANHLAFERDARMVALVSLALISLLRSNPR